MGDASTAGKPVRTDLSPSVSTTTICISGILVDIYGLEELPSDCRDVTCVWILHGRTLDRTWMSSFATLVVKTHVERNTDDHQRGVLAIAFDQRNHGSRLVSPKVNTDWLGGNPDGATDLYTTYTGTATDVSTLIDFLPCYLGPHRSRINQHVVAGVSLGGHAAWQLLFNEPRVTEVVVFIGCPDFIRLMSWRAVEAKLPSMMANESGFLGSKDFPQALVEAVTRSDPAALLVGQLLPLKMLQHSHPGWPSWAEHPDLTTQRLTDLVLPGMQARLQNKKVLNLYGTRDPTVPYHTCEPFIAWLKAATQPGGWFHGHGCTVTDIGVDGVHGLTPEMVDIGVGWICDRIFER